MLRTPGLGWANDRPVSIWRLGVWLLVSNCAAPRAIEQNPAACNDTLTCQKLAAEREQQFARAVAAEPPSERLAVEVVAPTVLVDRKRQVVYLLTRHLVALELSTGVRRWKAPLAVGDALWRAGRYLVVGSQGLKVPTKVTFIDPDAPARAATCVLDLAAPRTDEQVFVDAFDRAGQPYVYWRSIWTYRGGTPPDERMRQRALDAPGCGILKVDPTSCATSPVALADFMWNHSARCSSNSVGIDLPAAAASFPPIVSGGEPTLTVTTSETKRESCSITTKSTLEARTAAGAVLWTHELVELHTALCMPP